MDTVENKKARVGQTLLASHAILMVMEFVPFMEFFTIFELLTGELQGCVLADADRYLVHFMELAVKKGVCLLCRNGIGKKKKSNFGRHYPVHLKCLQNPRLRDGFKGQMSGKFKGKFYKFVRLTDFVEKPRVWELFQTKVPYRRDRAIDDLTKNGEIKKDILFYLKEKYYDEGIDPNPANMPAIGNCCMDIGANDDHIPRFLRVDSWYYKAKRREKVRIERVMEIRKNRCATAEFPKEKKLPKTVRGAHALFVIDFNLPIVEAMKKYNIHDAKRLKMFYNTLIDDTYIKKKGYMGKKSLWKMFHLVMSDDFEERVDKVAEQIAKVKINPSDPPIPEHIQGFLEGLEEIRSKRLLKHRD